jgi:hypothetical protein
MSNYFLLTQSKEELISAAGALKTQVDYPKHLA